MTFQRALEVLRHDAGVFFVDDGLYRSRNYDLICSL